MLLKNRDLPLLLLTLVWVGSTSVATARPGPTSRTGGLAAAAAAEARQQQAETLIQVPRSVGDDPRVAGALQAFSRGRVGWARVRLAAIRAEASPEDAPALDFLLARCDLRKGDLAAAEARFAAAVEALPELREQALVERALAAWAAGDHDRGDALVAQVEPTHARFPELVFGVVRRALEERRPADALAALARLDGHVRWRWNAARQAKWRADALCQRDGDVAAWHRRLAEVWRTWGRTEAAREAERTLRRVLEDPTLPTPLTLDELVGEAVDRARTGKRGARGRWLLRAAKARFGAQANGLPTLLVLQRHPSAWGRRTIREVDEALKLNPHPAIYDRLVLRKARALRGLGRSLDALAAYAEIGRTAHDRRRGAEALMAGGELASRMGRHADARWMHDRVLAQGGGDRPKALWKLAWASYRLGLWAEADAYLEILASGHPTAQDRSRRTYYERALYWRARIAQRRGAMPEAIAGWRFLTERFPHSYYATLARRWLSDAGESVKLVGVGGPNRVFVAPRPFEVRPLSGAAAAAAALYRVGMREEARASLRRLFDLGRLDARGVELLSAIYREKPDWWRSHWIVQYGDPLDVDPDGPERPRWLAAYPTPYSGVVHREAEEHAIDPHLVWAVMRQESAFRVRARSHARALGLMQVLYPTAKLVARSYLREREPKKSYVMTPRGNVHYGAAYLRHLIDRFDGHLALAIAGYNAGPGAVERWLKKFGALDSDEFVEEIPYDETRGYTRKVLRSYAVYRSLYGPELAVADPWRLPRQARGAPPAVARR